MLLLVPSLTAACTTITNCDACDADPKICATCKAGYKVNSKGGCIVDYSIQKTWPGACGTGSRQTPINIEVSKSTLCPANFEFYQDTKDILTLVQAEGIDLTISYKNLSTVTFINDQGAKSTYDSLQFHWHAPSEHTINGKQFDLELHVVHVNNADNTKLAVTGFLFTVETNLRNDVLDSYNYFDTYSQREFLFPKILKDKLMIKSQESWEMERSKLVYNYEGSLTTPPCSEIVTWFVYAEPIKITKRNYDRLKAAINDG